MLSDCHEDRLVVCRGVDRRNAVSTSRDTTWDNSGELVSVREGVVQALEERELGVV